MALDGGAFGNSPAEEDPDADSVDIAYNLRFAGQYYDRETNTFYNGARDYDPAIGRYLQSDPIGLAGGINTYAYVNGNPLGRIDPLGLATVVLIGGPAGWNLAGHVAIAFTGRGVYSYGTSEPFGSSVTAYLASQATYRSTTAYALNTTPEQEQRMINYLQHNYSQPGKYSILTHDCATAVNGALGSVGIGDSAISNAVQVGSVLLPQLPSTSGLMAASYPGASIIDLPQGAPVSTSMRAFNPRAR